MPDFLGLAAPLTRAQGGALVSRSTADVIRTSIQLILTTRLGERPFLRSFGSRLPELVFEPNDHILAVAARNATVDALRRWERRIELLDVQVTTREHEFALNLRYFIRSNATEDSLVLTFVRDI
jgi:phage baseplate assembly protein W